MADYNSTHTGAVVDSAVTKVAAISASAAAIDLVANGITDPGVDRILFYDFSGTAAGWLTPGNGISITTTNLNVDHDAADNFVANEHIDWTSTSSNFSTSGTAATGNLAVTGTVTPTSNIVMANTKYIGILGAEIITFNSAGTIVVTGVSSFNAPGFLVPEDGWVGLGAGSMRMNFDGTGSTIAIQGGTLTIPGSYGINMNAATWIGITGNELMTFNSAGNITVSGADLIVGDNIFMSSTKSIGISGDNLITFTASGTTAFTAATAYTFDTDIQLLTGKAIGISGDNLITFTGSGTTAFTGGTAYTFDTDIQLLTGKTIGISGDNLITFTGAGSTAFTAGSSYTFDALVAVTGAITASTTIAATGAITGASYSGGTVGGTTITASTGFALGTGDWIGIIADNLITFNATGTTAFTAATSYTFDALVNVTGNIQSSGDVILSDGNYIGISAAERVEFNTAGTAVWQGVNVGVNVTPTTKFVSKNSVLSEPAIEAQASAGSGKISLYFDGGGDAVYRAYDTGGTETIRLTTDAGDSWISGGGSFGVGTATPSSVVELAMSTENLEFVDSGSVGATQQDWIEVEVGGVQGYIYVHANK